MWAECARCGTIFRQRLLPQRFCGNTCARLFRYHGRANAVADPLQSVADRCHRFIVNAGDKHGVGPRELAAYVDAYRALETSDRFRVGVLLCKMPGIAFIGDPDFRFWPRYAAPPEAVAV